MKLRNLLFWSLMGFVLLQSACEQATTPTGTGTGTTTATVLSGIVLRSDNFNPVPNVLVYDASNLSQRDTTGTSGDFSLTYQLAGQTTVTLFAQRAGFGTDTASVTLTPGRDTSITMTVLADTSSPVTGAFTGKAANIVLVSSSDMTISIRGTGGNETASLEFEVRDSLGQAISASNQVDVSFTIVGGPGGGEYVLPATAKSDALTGRVKTTVTSGTAAGVVQVFAEAFVDGKRIRSLPVRVIIAGGFPVSSRFSLSVEKSNVPAVFDGIEDKVTAALADAYGNPVKGAAVYFTTTAGDIDAGGQTNETGRVSSTLRTSGTRPASGVALVTARTVGDSVTLSQSVPIVFSEATQISGPSAFIVIADSGEYDFNYTVADAHGNPLSEGTSISVSVSGDGSGDLELTGDKSVNVPDTQNPQWTTYTVRIRDRRTGGAEGNLQVTVTVTSRNGNLVQNYNGIVLGGGTSVYVPPSARQPAQIETGLPTRSAIDVSGVGGVENSVITFTVKDSVGVAFDASRRIWVNFDINFSPNSFTTIGTFPVVTPNGDSTDNAGRVRATIVSGTQAGVLQIVARVDRPPLPSITSEPARIVVRAGFPVQTHFAMTTNSYVFATTSPPGFGPTFGVQAADTFSNPIPSGTAAYFHSWAGNIQATAVTDANGRASVEFLGGPPYPTAPANYTGRPGVFYVVSHMIGKNGSLISDSVRVCWAIGPITVTGIPGAAVGIPQQSTSAAISLSIRDGRNNPLPVGTSISSKVDFTTDLTGIKFGISGDLSSEATFYQPNGPYVVDPGPGITDFTFYVSDLSSGVGAPVGQTVTVILTINAPNIGVTTISFPGVVN